VKDEGKFIFFSGLSRAAMTRRVVFLALLGGVLGLGVFTTYNATRWAGRPFPGFLVTPRLSISGVGLYNWTGTAAGLISYDLILKADGRDLGSQKELYEYAGRRAPGEAIRYTVKRDERIFEAAIAPMRFTLTDLLFLYGSYFLAGFVFVAIGAIVFFLKPDTHLSWISFLITLSMAVYYFSMFDMVSSNVGLYRAYIFTAGFASFAQLHFCLYFPEKARFVERIPRLQYLPFALAALHITLMEATYPDPLFVTLWKLNPLLAGLTTIILVASLLRSFFRGRSEIARQRAKVVLLGAGIAFPISNFFIILGSTFSGTVGKYPILNNYVVLPTLVFPVSIAYAIAKHNLFDVDVFIKRTVGYAIMTAVVGAAYLGLQIGLESVVLAPVFGAAARKITPVLFAFLVVFLFNPLNRRVQDVVDRMFYRKKFDYKATVTAVSDALSSVLNLDEIVRKIVHTIHAEMFIDRSGLVLVGGQGGGYPAYFLSDESDRSAEGIRSSTLPGNDPLVDLIRKKKRLVTKYDVAEDPHFADVKEACGKRFEELGASLAVPLLYRDEVKAVLAVGHKKSGHFFTREDVDLLQTLASHGAVAIENAHMAEQMKKEETVRTNLSRYLSPQIVDRIVQNNVQVNLGGDRKIVTVLFSDIRNFTTITEHRPPDQLVHILNEYFTEMAGIIFHHQGSLDKYIGDAIVAVFGSLIPLNTPAKNAVAAAIEMMERLPDLNRRWEARYDFYMNIGVGINTGEVFLGNIGSPERMEFTVIGDAVNVASRFSGLARPGQILVTKETLAHLGADFPVREHPPVAVKGKSDKLEVFEVVYRQSVT